MAKFILPTIGNGTGGTVVVGSVYLAVAANEGYTQILDAMERQLINMEPRLRKLFVALDTFQHWSYSDSPNEYSALNIPDLPVGGGGGLHALSHEDGGTDEIDVSALSGLLAQPQAPLSHTHLIADTTGLQTVLDGKASVVHSHSISDVTLLQTTLDAKAALVHTHAIADTTGLQTALNAKAALSHTHPESDVSSLVADLAGKSAVGHTHPASEVASGVLDIARIPTGTTGTTVPFGNDSRFTDSRTPLAHAASHKSGGSDAIKLDELAAPTDVTTLNADTAKHGLLLKLAGGTVLFLRADGTWATPTATATPFLCHPDSDVLLAADATQYVVNEYEVKPNRTTELAALAALEIG